MNDLNVLMREQVMDVGITALRDGLLEGLPRIAPLLPNVERIEPLSSRLRQGELERYDRWHGRTRSAVLGALLPAGIATWTVRSIWTLEPFEIAWQLEPVVFPLRVAGSGRIVFESQGPTRTRVRLLGSLALGGAASGWLAAAGLSRAERAVAALLADNLEALCRHAQTGLPEIVARPQSTDVGVAC